MRPVGQVHGACSSHLALLIFLCVGALACSDQVDLSSSNLALDHPNIVIIMADDLGWADISLHGSEVSTPNIDGMARDGVELNRFYVSPICSPTRAGMLSGRTPIHFGAQYTNWIMPTGEVTLAERFSSAGYRTAMIGKWHLGFARSELHPILQGFDSFYGMIGGVIDYYSHELWSMTDWQRNGVTIWRHGYSTQLMGQEAVRFVEQRNPEKPFLLYLAFNAPHTPSQAPLELIQKYEDAGVCPEGGRRCRFAAQVESMDYWIGRFLEALDDEGIADNTLVVFLTDNGADERFGGANYPLRGGKATLFEGGIRVPAIARWPGTLEAGRVVNQYMRDTDLFSTLEAAAGLWLKAPQESVNMWPVLRGAREFRRQPMFFAVDTLFDFEAEGDVQHAVIDGGLKLIRRDFENDSGQRVGTEFLLFDLDEDPEERENLARARYSDVWRLDRRIHRWAANHPWNGGRYHREIPFQYPPLPRTATALLEDPSVLRRVVAAKADIQ